MARPSMVRTVGHGTLPDDDFVALLRGAGIETVVDVRRYPGSRRHPQFQREAMEQWLPEQGVGYLWLPALGGRRQPAPDSPNTALRNQQFRAYADHMATGEFRAGVDALLEAARSSPVAIICAESLWWRCHRRLVADHLVLVEGVAVEHVFHDGRSVPHDPMPQAQVDGDHLVFPGAQV